MAHVRPVRRKAGTAYECRWQVGGKDRQRTFTTRREAERFALKIENEIAAGNSTEPMVQRGKTVSEVIAASLASSRPKLKASTYAGYEHLYTTRIEPIFGGQRIASVTSQHVEAWLATFAAKGRASSTIHNYFVALNKVFRYAERHRLINYNPCAAVELPRAGHAADFAPIFLTATQVETLAAKVDEEPPFGTMIRFAALTGLRSAEIAGLRVRDLNLSAGHVEVRQTVRKIAGEWIVGTPKSVRSTRDVPLLNRALVAELRELLLAHPDSGNPDALFWPARAYHGRGLDWERACDVGAVRRHVMTPAVTRLGMQPMRFHDLRHTFASLMLAAGFQPFEVSRYLGHSSLEMVGKVYGHLYPSDYSEQIAKFEAFVAKA
jgi:integrase